MPLPREESLRKICMNVGWMCIIISFFVCASILRLIRIISAQNMSLNVFSEIDSFAQKTTMPVIFLTNLCRYAKNLGLAVFPGGVPS